MNQPTREEFEQFKIELRAELREEVRKIQERHTEEMNVTRVELASADVQSSLDNHTKLLKEISGKQDEQEQQLTLIYTDVGHMKADVGVLKTKVEHVEAEVLKIRESQADFKDTLTVM